jgi:hypothetical protein
MEAAEARIHKASTGAVTRKVRKQWNIRGDTWVGKDPDGTLIRLSAPTLEISAITKGRPMCCAWMGEVRVRSAKAQFFPHKGEPAPFEMRYQAVRISAEMYDLVPINHAEVTAPSDEEIAKLGAL